MSFCQSHRDEHVAVKIVRNIDCFREVAMSEIAVLEEIKSLDDDHRLWAADEAQPLSKSWTPHGRCSFVHFLLFLITNCHHAAPVWECWTGLNMKVTSASCLSCWASAPLSSCDRRGSCPSLWSRSDTWPSRSSEPSAVSHSVDGKNIVFRY